MFAKLKLFVLIFAISALSVAIQDDRGTKPPTNDVNIQYDAMNIADVQNMTEMNKANIEKLDVRFSGNVTTLKNQQLATQKSVAAKAKEVENLALQEDLKLEKKLTQHMNILKQALENQMMAKSTVVVKIFDQKLNILEDLAIRLKSDVETLNLNVKQVKEENNILSSQVQLQKGELQKQFAQKTEALNKTINNLKKKNGDLKVTLERKTIRVEGKLNQTTKILYSSVTNLQSEMSSQVGKMKSELKSLKNSWGQSVMKLKMISSQLVNFVSSPRWPKGSYCFLSNGACPSGFRKINGWMSGIRHSSSSRGFRAGRFGDSYITCTGRGCNYFTYSRYSDLYLSTCCK